MTLYWDILDDGALAVWTWDQDPQTDTPAVTRAADGDGWTWAGEFPRDTILDLCWGLTMDYYAANNQTVDINVVRMIAEVAFEQVERRSQL